MSELQGADFAVLQQLDSDISSFDSVFFPLLGGWNTVADGTSVVEGGFDLGDLLVDLVLHDLFVRIVEEPALKAQRRSPPPDAHQRQPQNDLEPVRHPTDVVLNRVEYGATERVRDEGGNAAGQVQQGNQPNYL